MDLSDIFISKQNFSALTFRQISVNRRPKLLAEVVKIFLYRVWLLEKR